MDKFDIITNNPAVLDAYPDMAKIYDVGVMEVFTIVRDLVHRGTRILSHPLSGSLKPWESPFKSIMVSCSVGFLDFESLKLIENAIGLMSNRRLSRQVYSSEVLEDFGIIDLCLINSATKSDM